MKLAETLVCPITGEVMRDPVIDTNGHSYEREAIQRWIEQHGTSPITRTPLRLEDLAPNRALREAIESIEEGENSTEDVSTQSDVCDPPDPISLRIMEHQVSPDELDVLVSVVPPRGLRATPSDVVCVVDTSGSMGTEATMKNSGGGVESHGLSLLDIVKHAVRTIITSLRSCDRLSIVSYSSNARVVIELLSMDEEGKKKAMVAVDALSASGMTNLWDGLYTGLEQIRGGDGVGRQSTVLLLTDGLPNVEPPRGHVPMLRRYKDQHGLPLCTVSTFGFGYNLDSLLLAELASEGKGSFSFIPDSSFVGTAFVHAVANLRAECASNVTLALEPCGGAVITSVVSGAPGEANPHTAASWGVNFPLTPVQFGQTRDIMVRMKLDPDSSEGRGDAPYVIATCKYQSTVPTETGRGMASVVNERSLPRAEDSPEGMDTISYHEARLQLVACVSTALNFLQTGDIEAAQKLIDELVLSTEDKRSQLSGQSYFTSRYDALVEDLVGQIKEALSRQDYASKWGAHYLRSLGRAHALQRCHNFKDPGVQDYGGKLFSDLRDEADDLFMKLPPPRPTIRSSSRSSSRPVASMSTYNNRGNPCFHGDCRVLMADGTRKRCDQLTKGDAVATPSGIGTKILCVVQTHCKGSVAELIRIVASAPENTGSSEVKNQELLVTPWHPVRNTTGSLWAFPFDLAPDELRIRPCNSVFSFVLESEHVVIIEGVQCVALAHGFEGDVVGHPYYGSERILQDLRSMRGWGEGHINLETGCDQRDPVTQMVCKLVQSERFT